VIVLPPVHSGVSLYSEGLIAGFEKANANQSLVAIANASAKTSISTSNLKLLRVWTRGPRYIMQVFSTLIREKPAVVHFQHEFFLYGGALTALMFPFLLLLTRLAGMRVVVTMHGVIPKRETNSKFAEAFFVTANPVILKLALGLTTMLISKFSNVIIVHSESLKKTLNLDYNVPLRKIHVIQHGIGDPKPVTSAEYEEKSVLFFGNITPSKGLEVLIDAFEKIDVPDSKLIIAGSPHPRGKKYFANIEQRIRQSPVSKNIVLTGYVKDEEIHRLFEKSSLVVFPYTCAVSCSGGLAFALQHHKPVVVTNLPTFTETITNGKNGLVVPINDAISLALAIRQLLLDRELRERISIQIEQNSAEILWSTIAGRTLECYQHVRFNAK
jgi:glycosyltransferase involved in cell wall biosynthesis